MIPTTTYGFQLEAHVRHRITGFEGVVVGLAHYATGMWNVCVQPTDLKEGEMRKARWIEEPDLDLVKGAERQVGTVDRPRFSFGSTVRNTVTKTTGVVHALTFWLNGCIRYELMLTQPDKDGNTASETIDGIYLESVEAPETAELPGPPTSGGPEREPTRATPAARREPNRPH